MKKYNPCYQNAIRASNIHAGEQTPMSLSVSKPFDKLRQKDCI